MTESASKSSDNKAPLWPKLLTIVVIAAVIALGILMLPRGFSGDLSAIGQGKPAAVHIYNKESMASISLMDLLGKLRSEYEDRVVFVVADMSHEQGERFAGQQNLAGGELVLFDAAGRRVAVINPPHERGKLRSALDQLIGRQ